MIGIYLIRDTQTSKVYIGKSIDIFKRWKEHENQGKAATLYEDEFHFNLNLRPKTFTFEILEVCSEEQLANKEDYYIKLYNSIEKGYNKINAANNKTCKKTIARTNRDMVNRLNEIMGKPLFVEDKKKLAEFFGYRDKRGNILGWNTLKKHLIVNNFEIIETKRKVNNVPKNCSIISIKYNY